MSKKFKKIAILLLAVSISSIGIYSTLSNKDNEVDKAQASSISSDELAKQAIQDKMINSLDYFKNAKGSFRYYVKKSNIDDTVIFKVKLNGKPASYTKDVLNNYPDQEPMESTFDGDNLLSINNEDKEFSIDPVLKPDPVQPKPSKL